LVQVSWARIGAAGLLSAISGEYEIGSVLSRLMRDLKQVLRERTKANRDRRRAVGRENDGQGKGALEDTSCLQATASTKTGADYRPPQG